MLHCDRSAEAGTTELATRSGLDLVEGFEDPRQVLGRNTDAGVLYAKPKRVVRSGIGDQFDRDGDRSGRGELDGIAGEVHQHADQVLGAPHDWLGDARIHFQAKIQALDGRHGRQCAHDMIGGTDQLEGHQLALRAFGLQLGQVEHLLDLTVQAGGHLVDGACPVGNLRVRGFKLDQLGRGDDAR